MSLLEKELLNKVAALEAERDRLRAEVEQLKRARAVREPLTQEQIRACAVRAGIRSHYAREDLCLWSFKMGIEFAESAHGIGAEGGAA